MAETHVIHETGGNTGTDNSFGFLMGIILLIAFLFFLFFYGLPLMRNWGTPGGSQQNVTIPDSGSGNQSPNIKIPDKVDINVNK